MPKELIVLYAEKKRPGKPEQGKPNEVEGKIDTAKTKYDMNKIMAKWEKTNKTWMLMVIFKPCFCNVVDFILRQLSGYQYKLFLLLYKINRAF